MDPIWLIHYFWNGWFNHQLFMLSPASVSLALDPFHFEVKKVNIHHEEGTLNFLGCFFFNPKKGQKIVQTSFPHWCNGIYKWPYALFDYAHKAFGFPPRVSLPSRTTGDTATIGNSNHRQKWVELGGLGWCQYPTFPSSTGNLPVVNFG